ncbi:hypothetical protein ABZP36_033831 [Zizania latifolia]
MPEPAHRIRPASNVLQLLSARRSATGIVGFGVYALLQIRMASLRICRPGGPPDPRRGNLAADLIGFSSWVLLISSGCVVDQRHAAGGVATCHGFLYVDSGRRKAYPRASLVSGAVCSVEDSSSGESMLCVSDPPEDCGWTSDLCRNIVDGIGGIPRSSAGKKEGEQILEESSGVSYESSIEECNSVFIHLEKHSDKTTLGFFGVDEGCALDARGFNGLVYVCAKRRHDDSEGATEILKDMRAAGCQCSSIVTLLVWAYGSVGRMHNVLQILQACFYEKVDELSRVFDEMIQQGYLANTVTLNVLLHIYGKAGLFNRAEKVFLMAHKHGLADIISRNTIFAAYAQNKDFRSMAYFVQRMQEAGFPVSLEAHNSMLDAYGKAG